MLKQLTKHLPLKIGAAREQQARQFLMAQGLQPVDSNFRCKAGEIDLIMREADCLVFVEVRYRRNAGHGSAAESIDSRKQRKLERAATFYLQQHGLLERQYCRFDAVCIEGTGTSTSCQWIQNIFA